MAAKKLTKAEIVDSLYEKTGMNRREIRIMVDLFIDELKEALAQDAVIELRGFGTFEVKIRKGRAKARNPRTGETVAVTSHGIAAFRPGQELKQNVWNIGQGAAAGSQAGPRLGAQAGTVPPGKQ
jgi:integration host factor subunit beta